MLILFNTINNNKILKIAANTISGFLNIDISLNSYLTLKGTSLNEPFKFYTVNVGLPVKSKYPKLMPFATWFIFITLGPTDN